MTEWGAAEMRLDEVIQQPGQRERSLKDSIMQDLHVALPGHVVSYNDTEKTVNVQPSIRLPGNDGPMPMLLDVPVFFPGYFTFTVNPGDECIVIFADRCIDAWCKYGKQTVAISARRHDLSDGIALVGFIPKNSTRATINLTELEQRVRTLEERT